MIEKSIPYLVRTKSVQDPAGNIRVLDDTQIPFKILRIFWLFDVPDNIQRGGHAHRSSQQLLICSEGSIEAKVEDLKGKKYQFNLRKTDPGLYLPPMCWGTFIFRQNARALCLASDYFSEADYIREYGEFEAIKHAHKNL